MTDPNEERLINLEHQVSRLEDDLTRTAADANEANRSIKNLTEILGKLLMSYSHSNELRPVTFRGIPESDPHVQQHRLFAEAKALLQKFQK